MPEAAPATPPVATSEPAAQPVAAPEAPAPKGALERVFAAMDAVEGKQEAPKEEAPAAPAEGAPKSRAEQRKAFLDADVAKRRADAAAAQARREQAAAREMTERAQSFGQSISGWEQDPLKLARAAGIPDKQFAEAVLQYALTSKAPPDPDPVEAKIRDAVAPYIKAQEEERQHRAEYSYIETHIRPIVDPEKHECLLTLHDGNERAVAAAVFTWIKQQHQQTGHVYQPQEAFDWLEGQLEKRLRGDLDKFSKIRRFAPASASASASAPVAAPASAPAAAPSGGTSLSRRRTLTNRQNVTPSSAGASSKPADKYEAVFQAAEERMRRGA